MKGIILSVKIWKDWFKKDKDYPRVKDLALLLSKIDQEAEISIWTEGIGKLVTPNRFEVIVNEINSTTELRLIN